MSLPLPTNNLMPAFVGEAVRAHVLLRERGAVPEGGLRDPIAKSWRRSIDAGTDYSLAEGGLVLCRSSILECEERDHDLLACSEPFMESLYEEIQGSSSLVLLTDSAGMVLRATIDTDFSEAALRAGAAPGSVWREECRGTNAMAIAIADREPAEVLGPEHFLPSNAGFACAAAPIFDPDGNLRGVLDATTDFRAGKTHSLALVRLFAKAIENQLLQASSGAGSITIHFHVRPQFIGTPWEGIAIVSEDGTVTSVNASGRRYLSVHIGPSDTIDALFGVTHGTLTDHTRRRLSPLIKLRPPSGVVLYAKLESGGCRSTHPGTQHRPWRRSANVGTAAVPADLAALDSGDVKVRRVIEKLSRVVDRDISVIIQGETGTGKELLARALHASGRRRDGPFVAVNCASIPDGLIEAELFGYSDGAFTGARRRGSPGKVLQASGGTLFLDEIGDMPENMQSRLLRVLQEREVVPLGSSQCHKVDIAVVSATHRDLKDLISQGRFRQDLYYRLNGLVVSLPALRERTDLVELVARICERECDDGWNISLSTDVERLFRTHPWPGNIRQLQAVLRTAIAMLGKDRVIGTNDLCSEFLDDKSHDAENCIDNNFLASALPRIAEPSNVNQGAFKRTNLRQMEVALVHETVNSAQGNISLAASQLGISRTTVYRLLRAGEIKMQSNGR